MIDKRRKEYGGFKDAGRSVLLAEVSSGTVLLFQEFKEQMLPRFYNLT